MQRSEYYLEKAFYLAMDTYSEWNYPIGAFLVVNDRVEIEWQNKVVSQWDHRLHAEMDILQKSADFKTTKDKKVLFVTLEPCNNCAKALCEYGIDEVCYILEDPSWGWKNIMEQSWIQVHQIKYRYEEYLDIIIGFMTKHGNYNEVLNQYISIKESWRNSYQERLDKAIYDTFINIPDSLVDYEVRKIVYNNTLSYLKSALLRTPESRHHLVFAGYSGDVERIIDFCQKYRENNTTKLNEKFIKWLHRMLYPEWYTQKFKNPEWEEFIWMIPWEYRKIDIISNDNMDKYIYFKPIEIEKWIEKIIQEYNEGGNDIQWNILYFLADFFIVHPFWDGNGRVAYILTDLLLLKNGLQPLYLWKRKENDKVWFYKILDEVYKTRDLAPFYEFIEKYFE